MLSRLIQRCLPVVFILLTGFTAIVHADYPLPESLFGYKMYISSHAEQGEKTMFIGFVQEQGTPAPFVLIETFSNNIIMAEVTTETRENKLFGKIHLPAGLTGPDIRELRINGYTILWKHIETK